MGNSCWSIIRKRIWTVDVYDVGVTVRLVKMFEVGAVEARLLSQFELRLPTTLTLFTASQR